MTLARRHFAELAQKVKMAREQVRDLEIGTEYSAAMDALDTMERSLILFCEADSPTFDRAKFQEAAKL